MRLDRQSTGEHTYSANDQDSKTTDQVELLMCNWSGKVFDEPWAYLKDLICGWNRAFLIAKLIIPREGQTKKRGQKDIPLTLDVL